MLTVLSGSTVGYPSDSLASCFVHPTGHANKLNYFRRDKAATSVLRMPENHPTPSIHRCFMYIM